MIYLVVKESGQYSDYNKENIFAAASRESAENKIKELESDRKPILEASSKREEIKLEWKRENTFSLAGPRFDKQAYMVWYNQYNHVHDRAGLYVCSIYNITLEQLNNYYSLEGKYLIEEVASEI